MFIDFVACLLLVMAIFKGLSKGLIVAVFSLLAFFIGLVAAMKLSASVAVWLQQKSGTESTWMPFIAFVLVMVAVMLLIRFGAKLIEKLAGLAMLGWFNKIGGIIFYALLYFVFFSIVLFYATQLKLISPETAAASRTYSLIAPMGPACVEAIGSVIPIFKGLFAQLESFFDAAARRGEAN